MNLLITVKKKGWSGETAIILDLARGLRAEGHTIFLAAKRGSASESRALDAGLEVFNVVFETGPLRIVSQWGDFRRLGRLVRERGIQLIHAHASWDHWISGFTAKKALLRVPLVRTKHNLKRIRTHVMNRWLYKELTDALIAPSQAVRRHLCESPAVPTSRIHSIPNGIRADVFDDRDRDAVAIRSSLGVGSGEILVAFSSRLSRRKNPEGFIDAARLLSGSGRPLRFVVAGSADDEYWNELRKRAEGLGRLAFLGHWDDMPGLLAAIDIFVLVSHTEAFGLAPLEAMAMQKPVVVSPAEGFRDFLKPGENGLMLEKNEPGTLAEAILRLADDPELRRRLGEEGRRTVETGFTSEVMVARTIELYRKLIASG
jgi:glycosyltransferase involved in cell wall biosynthesis